ncbi:MAG: patatin-like phospholipase family protein [Clostridia bacterium]|nr:patatin-like phospholipase family protein [Clostridia bacterium]
MQLKLDTNKVYAIALEGGGAKGGYEIGVWKALNEVGIRYEAVSGTSVGALNGAMMAMRDYDKAVEAWNGIRMSSIVSVSEAEESELKKMFSGAMPLGDLPEYLPRLLDLVKSGGLDIAPMRAWMRAVIEPEKIRKSDVNLYVTTVSLGERKGLEIKVNDLETDEQIYDMLLASAYHPAFKNEPLSDGKQYLDGGAFDSFPLHALVENGYKDLIGVRLPGGLGIERAFRIPDDVHVTIIKPNIDLGGALDFDAERARYHMQVGYFDTKRVLYGLYGRKYYIERTLSDRNALDWLLDRYERDGKLDPLRPLIENELPAVARRLGLREGDYYELMLAVLEEEAEQRGVDPFVIRTDRDFMRAIADVELARRKAEKDAVAVQA